MYRRKIRSICNSYRHPFPVAMRFAGTRWDRGTLVYVMYCPVCRRNRSFVYTSPGRYVRVA